MAQGYRTRREGSGLGRLIAEVIKSDPDLSRAFGIAQDDRTPEQKAQQERIQETLYGTIQSNETAFAEARKGLLHLRETYGEVVGIKGADDDLIEMIKAIDTAEKLLGGLVDAAKEIAQRDQEPPF